MLSTIFTKRQLLDLYPQLGQVAEGEEKAIIEELDTIDHEEDYPDSTNSQSKPRFTPDIVKDYDTFELNKYRLIESFSKIKVPYFRMVNLQTGDEKFLMKQLLLILCKTKKQDLLLMKA